MSRPSGRQGRLALLAALAVLVLAQALLFRAAAPQLVAGQFTEADSYMWLGRAERLRDTGDWYNKSEPRGNWPYGELLLQARPFDLLLLAGATALKPALGFQAGLFWWGAVLSPVLYVLLGLALAWSAGAALGPGRGALAVLLLATQRWVQAYGSPGRADHHLLIMVAVVLTLGLVARLLLAPQDRRNALVAGAVAGFGLWLSLEFLLALAVCFAGLALAWVRQGKLLARAGSGFTAGLVAMLVVALLAERPPGDLLVPEYQRISCVHLVMAAIACGFFAAMAWIEGRARRPLAVRDRVQLGFLGGFMALLALWLWFPDFFGGPVGTMDPRAEAVLVTTINEESSLWPTTLEGLAPAGMLLALALVALPGLAYLIVRETEGPRSGVWAFLGLATLVYLTVGFAMLRFAPYAELILVLLAAEAGVRLHAAATLRLGVAGGRGVAATGVALLLALAAGTGQVTADSIDTGTGSPCTLRMKPMAEFLVAGAPPGPPYVIAGWVDVASELLYRTPHRFIATANFANQEGAIAVFDLLGSVTDDQALAVVRDRGIDHILLCRWPPLPPSLATAEPLNFRLMRGEIPGWLREVTLPSDLEPYFLLLETR